MSLSITDSCFQGSEKEYKDGKLSLVLQAIDTLNSDFKNKKIDIVSFGTKVRNDFDEPLISYEITEQGTSYNSFLPSKAKFYTSHYIGYYTTYINGKNVSITINPRFGDEIRNYLLSYALGLYLPKGDSSNESSKFKNLWLIALLWRANAEKAITKSQIPKIYKKVEKNQSYFRGKLNIQKHIRHNSVDKSKFYCNYSKFSFENSINQTIRYCYRVLIKSGFKDILKGFSEHEAMLGDFGVSNNPITLEEINKIVYTPFTKYYKPLMEISKSIIKFKNYQNSSNLLQKSGFSVFLDMAEVWENYLYHLLKKNLEGFEIENPNLSGDYSIFNDGSRKIRPDLLIKKGDKIVAVIDAKYKYYTKVGSYAGEPGAINREDLYQMMTYLHRFGTDECIGLFVSPFAPVETEPKKICNTKQKIGVLGIEIEDKNCIDSIKKQEDAFIETLKTYLNKETQ